MSHCLCVHPLDGELTSSFLSSFLSSSKKVNSPVIRQENPGIRNEDVFKLVAQRYRMSKDAAAAPQPGAEGEGGHSSAMGSLGV